MLEPIIGFSVFFIIIFFVIKSANKNRENLYEYLIENLKTETELYVEQTKSSTMAIGMNTGDFIFNRCDLYLTKNAIVILGFTKDIFFKQFALPIILTSELNEFTNRFPFAHVKKVSKIEVENNIVKFNFGNKGITKTEVVLKLKSLKEIEIAKIKQIAEENNW